MSNGVPFETTLHIRDHCLCLHAQQAARALSRLFDAVMRPLGITSGQFSLLNAVNRPKPAPIGSVARLLVMDRTTLTANLKPLERKGLIAIAPDPEDRRGRLVSLTGKGREVLAKAVPLWNELHSELEGKLDDGGDRLRSGLRTLS